LKSQFVAGGLDLFWLKIYPRISEKGSLWLLVENLYRHGELIPVAQELINRVSDLTEFKLKNVIVVFRISSSRPQKGRPLTNAYFLIGHFVKSLESSFFDKDRIREPHVFERIEWGRRRKGRSGYRNNITTRYNKKGRDPGNVFYRVKRDAVTGHVLSVNSLSDREVFSRIIQMSTVRGWRVATNSKSKNLAQVARHLGRELVEIDVKHIGKIL
jgi:hypothetical protein